MAGNIPHQYIEVFFFEWSDQAKVAADSVCWLVESVNTQTSPEERFRRQALLHSGRKRQVLLNLSLMLFEPPVCCSELLFRTFLFRNVGQRHDRETPSLGPLQGAHTHHHGQLPTVLRGQ